jgi:pimeloyl-ACP methyl ester carboxylesterase
VSKRAIEHALFEKDRRVTASDGTEIAYTVVGDGQRTPVMFLNGWTCPDAYWARTARKVVEAGHKAVMVDTRGHGQSGLPRPPRQVTDADVSVNRLATDVVEVLRDAEVGPAVLAGHSMGVQALFEAWRVDPSCIAGLVPCAGTFENPVPTFADQAWLDKVFPVAEKLFARLPLHLVRYPMAHAHRTPTALTMRALRALRVANEVVEYADVDPHVRQFADLDLGVLWRMMVQMRHHSAADIMPGITVPVLVLAGQRDTFTPMSVQRKMESLLPDVELVVFENGGHLLPVEEADGVAAALLDWLDRRVDRVSTSGRGRPRTSAARAGSASPSRPANRAPRR